MSAAHPAVDGHGHPYHEDPTLNSRIEAAVSAATDAFWAEIAAAFPEAKHGDLPLREQIAVSTEMDKVVRVWIDLNVPVAGARP